MEHNNNDEKDPNLWKIAQRRAGFKRDLMTYFAVNAFLWLIWFLTTDNTRFNKIPWPVWPTAGWGLAIVLQYFETYRYPKENAAEKEYEKLKQKQQK